MSLLRAALCLSGLLAAAAVLAGSREEAELEKVRKRLDELKSGLAADLANKDRMSAELRAAETDIAGVSRELERLRGERREAEQRIAALDRERERGLATMKSERSALAAQVRMAFASGRHERIKLLLNQQDPAVLGRMMVYYEYFNRMRRASIDAVSGDLARLGELSREVSRRTRQLESLEAEQARELHELQQARERRAQALAALSGSIRTKGEEQARLEEQAATLEQLVEELREALKDFPLDSQREFASLKGDLAWPLQGTLLSDFGDARAGGHLRWRGVLIAAQAGDEVRAVYHGRVAYADWLPGMGLLVILDHGDGFMTLYGHNQSLFRSAGDWVGPGEVIAAVGNSGGLPAPSLYFEVRKGTRPLNPHEWFARPLARR